MRTANPAVSCTITVVKNQLTACWAHRSAAMNIASLSHSTLWWCHHFHSLPKVPFYCTKHMSWPTNTKIIMAKLEFETWVCLLTNIKQTLTNETVIEIYCNNQTRFIFLLLQHYLLQLSRLDRDATLHTAPCSTACYLCGTLCKYVNYYDRKINANQHLRKYSERLCWLDTPWEHLHDPFNRILKRDRFSQRIFQTVLFPWKGERVRGCRCRACSLTLFWWASSLMKEHLRRSPPMSARVCGTLWLSRSCAASVRTSCCAAHCRCCDDRRDDRQHAASAFASSRGPTAEGS